MPAVSKARKSRYCVLADGKVLEKGTVLRKPQPEQTLADYVDTRMGAAHSRWMIAPGPWMPFSMVKLSPDNQNMGWQAGYQPTFETLGCFSHIHEWTMAGLGMMPTNGPLFTQVGVSLSDFDPFRTGSNQHYVEGNAWQLSYFVPQDVPALIGLMGKEAFVDRLNWGFEASEPWRYNAPNDQYWDYPVVQGNQQSMHFAFLFNWAGKPWLTQKWSRSIIDRYYGAGIANAYLGDEDQGQMSAWFVMAALGLFQTDGGCRVDPIYEIASPLFEQTVIDLGGRYGRGASFTIEAKHASRSNKYVQRAELNGQLLDTFCFPASELLKGGRLVLEMGDTPNKEWGILGE